MEVNARTLDGQLDHWPESQAAGRNRMLRIGHCVSRRVATLAWPISQHTVVFLSDLRKNAPAGGSRPHFVLKESRLKYAQQPPAFADG